jgi:hypothetical protein
MSARTTAGVVLILWLALAATDCARKLGGIESFGMEEMENGYLFKIRTERPAGDVSAFVGPGNWVLITVADSTLDTTRIASFRSALVDSADVHWFRTAFQVSLHMTIPVAKAEVVHRHPDREILISIFRREQPGT